VIFFSVIFNSPTGGFGFPAPRRVFSPVSGEFQQKTTDLCTMALFEKEEIGKFHLPITGKNGKWKFSFRGHVLEGDGPP